MPSLSIYTARMLPPNTPLYASLADEVHTSDIYLHNYFFLSTKAKNKAPVYQLTHIATGAKILNQKN